jgi:transcriptional regulator with XRE-family HTH domain
MKVYYDKLRRIRKGKKLTIEELATNSGVSKTTISDIENYQVVPTVETICKLAKALECEPQDLFDCGE